MKGVGDQCAGEAACEPRIAVAVAREFRLATPCADSGSRANALQKRGVVRCTDSSSGAPRSRASRASAIRKPSRPASESASIWLYRARLVADVVTGKLDVREAAELLPYQEVGDGWPEDGPSTDDDGIPGKPADGLTIEGEVAR